MKQGVWGIWIGGAAAILLGSGWVSTVGHWVVWITLVAHVVEFFVKRPLFALTESRTAGTISRAALR